MNKCLIKLSVACFAAVVAYVAQTVIASAQKSVEQELSPSPTAQLPSASRQTTDGQSKESQAVTLKDALEGLDKDPQAAAQKLRKLDSPSAKAYLAYLYFTHKAAITNAEDEVASLMKKAIEDIQDDSFSGINSDEHYHYKDLETLLLHLRLVTDADATSVPVPASIFKEYPDAAFTGFGPHWGSTRDGYLNIDFDAKEDISQIPEVRRLETVLAAMAGNPCSRGTVRFMFDRMQTLAIIRASLAPQSFGTEGNAPADQELDHFLQIWSNQQLWNKVKYEEWVQATKDAETPLANFYAKRFPNAYTKDKPCAKNVLNGINRAFFSYEPSALVESDVYKTYHQKGLTLSQAQAALKDKALSKDKLGEALCLAILNDADIAVIKWLLQKGAPLAGPQESVLFTAVHRPDVVDLLLKCGAKPNDTNLLGKTALFQAVQFNCLPAAKKLLLAGADINHAMKKIERDDDSTLNLAGDYGYYNYTVGSRTPLMYAAAFAGPTVIQFLLEHGANKNALDSSGANAAKYLAANNLLSPAERADLISKLRPSKPQHQPPR